MVERNRKSRTVTGLGGRGKGNAERTDWIEPGSLPPNCNMCATMVLEPGASVSDHTHTGEAEIYSIVSGTGVYNDNGIPVEVGAGDVALCRSGEMHGIENTGVGPLTFYAIIVGG